jgi:hypothetical protein
MQEIQATALGYAQNPLALSRASASVAPAQRRRAGMLLAEITNRIVAFMREHYGRGPIKAKTYALDDAPRLPTDDDAANPTAYRGASRAARVAAHWPSSTSADESR